MYYRLVLEDLINMRTYRAPTKETKYKKYILEENYTMPSVKLLLILD